MGPYEFKARYRRFVDEVWNQGDLAVVDELLSPDVVHRLIGHRTGVGVDGVKQSVTEMRRAFPDLHGIIEDHVTEGDTAMARVACAGTQDGPLAELPATGTQATFELIEIDRFDGAGVIIEHRSTVDMLELLQQLGAIPAGAPWHFDEHRAKGVRAVRRDP